MPCSVDVEEIIAGNILKIKAEFEKVKMFFINVYAPTVGTERLAFLNVLRDVIQSCSSEEHLILGGDFNCMLLLKTV